MKDDVLRKRIVGLTSFYEKFDETKFPKHTVNLVPIEMSDYQLAKYQPFRMAEIEEQKKQMKRKGQDETLKSSYRIYSRLHCSFAFPDEIGSPYGDKDDLEIYEKLEEILEAKEYKPVEDKDTRDSFRKLESANKKDIEKVDKLNKKILVALEKESDKYLTFDIDDDTNSRGKLHTYSPKYVHIIRDIINSVGCCFVYSQFLEMVGLKTLALALKATGRFAPLEIKKVDNQYMIDLSDYDDVEAFKGKMKYIFYAGSTKDKQLREIYRQIYNSEFDKLPPSCIKMKQQLIELYGEDQNLHGNVIKVFLTTRSGAEGVDLKHIRKIYVMEPYWQPVLIKQVIGRGVRYESHIRLPPDERNVEVYIYMATFSTKQIKNDISGVIRHDVARNNVSDYQKMGKPITSDENLYITSKRKLEMIDQIEDIMKDSAFDCTLNYADNIQNIANKRIVCFDYDAINRNDIKSYISAPNVEDTIDIVEFDQEDSVKVVYHKVELPKGSNKFYWKLAIVPVGERMFLYSGDSNPVNFARLSKPVGEIVVDNGKKKILFFKKRSYSKKQSSKKQSSKKSKVKNI